MKKLLISASIAALGFATGAQAADIIQPQPVAPYQAPAFSWTGFYIGAQAGYSWSKGSVKANEIIDHHKFSPDPDGFIGGIYLGYNYEFSNRIVLGLETDMVWGNLDDKGTSYPLEGVIGGGQSALNGHIKQKWAGATRVRLGYGIDRWMPYVAGGVAYSKIKSGIRQKSDGTAPNNFLKDNTFTGWTIGTGVDYAVTDNLLLRLEYRYSDYGNKSNSYNEVLKLKTKFKTNDIRAGIAYKF